jgi:hypothetical protein
VSNFEGGSVPSISRKVTVWLLTFNFIHFMAAFLGSIHIRGQWSNLDPTWFIGQEIQIQI